MPGPKLGQLGDSTTGEVEHIEKEDERLVLLQSLGKRQLAPTRRRKLELGSPVTHLEHALSLKARRLPLRVPVALFQEC